MSRLEASPGEFCTTGTDSLAETTSVQNTARSAGAFGVFYWEPAWYAVQGKG